MEAALHGDGGEAVPQTPDASARTASVALVAARPDAATFPATLAALRGARSALAPSVAVRGRAKGATPSRSALAWAERSPCEALPKSGSDAEARRSAGVPLGDPPSNASSTAASRGPASCADEAGRDGEPRPDVRPEENSPDSAELFSENRPAGSPGRGTERGATPDEAARDSRDGWSPSAQRSTPESIPQTWPSRPGGKRKSGNKSETRKKQGSKRNRMPKGPPPEIAEPTASQRPANPDLLDEPSRSPRKAASILGAPNEKRAPDRRVPAAPRTFAPSSLPKVSYGGVGTARAPRRGRNGHVPARCDDRHPREGSERKPTPARKSGRPKGKAGGSTSATRCTGRPDAERGRANDSRRSRLRDADGGAHASRMSCPCAPRRLAEAGGRAAATYLAWGARARPPALPGAEWAATCSQAPSGFPRVRLAARAPLRSSFDRSNSLAFRNLGPAPRSGRATPGCRDPPGPRAIPPWPWSRASGGMRCRRPR